jgi:hypothetical protein
MVMTAGCSRGNDTMLPAVVETGKQSAALVAPPETVAPKAAVTAGEKTWDGVYRLGSPGKNGGLVYLVEGSEYYEALKPGDTLGADEALPSGWVAPDMEDFGLIRTALQQSGAADYGEWWYFSVSKSAGKNRYFRISDGTDTVSPTGKTRKLGVRLFKDEAAASATVASTISSSATVASGISSSADTAPAQTAPAATQTALSAAPKYAVGEAGPGGGIVFSNAGGKYKEITMPGKEDSFAARSKREEEHYRTLSEQVEADRKVIDQASAEGNQQKVEELVNESNARIQNYPPPAPFLPAGWRVATMPELITVYDTLKKTGKVNFGNVLYLSSSTINYRGSGTKYSRNAVSYVPDAENPGPFGPAFPGYRIILAGGGAGSVHLMNMGDGAIILVGDELSAGDYPLGYKNFSSGETCIPYVREF